MCYFQISGWTSWVVFNAAFEIGFRQSKKFIIVIYTRLSENSIFQMDIWKGKKTSSLMPNHNTGIILSFLPCLQSCDIEVITVKLFEHLLNKCIIVVILIVSVMAHSIHNFHAYVFIYYTHESITCISYLNVLAYLLT